MRTSIMNQPGLTHKTNMIALRLSLMFSIFISFASSQTSTACSRIRRRLINPLSTCIAEASRLQPASMLELANGSCLMFDVCSTPVTSGDSFPLYQLKSFESTMLLLRTHAEGSLSPYKLLMDGPDNASIVTRSDLTGTVYPYRNPMISVSPSMFSKIHLLLSNGSNTHVNLTFSMDRSKTLKEEGSWFSKEKLQTSYPWNVSDLKAGDFGSFFTMPGYTYYHTISLRFFMMLKGNIECETIQGYMVVVENKYCDYQETTYTTSYQ